MRTFETILGAAALGAAILSVSPAGAFDISALQSETPEEAFRQAATLYQAGDKLTAIEVLEFAAGAGHPIAQWKLGRMYADGDGIMEDDLRAFRLFSEVANAHADDNPGDANSPYIANAFVAIGLYYQSGIPNSEVGQNTGRARQIFNYAASYFGDPDAQTNLARMWYEGIGGERDPRQAARWAKLAADKGSIRGQALLGFLLFQGEGIAREPTMGLVLLSVARERDPSDPWIQQMHEQAFSLASEPERRGAISATENWVTRSNATAMR